jgi:hypothetical protein
MGWTCTEPYDLICFWKTKLGREGAMHLIKFLHNFVFNALPKVHKVRLDAIISTVSSLLHKGKLTLTALGQNMDGKAMVKHKIKRVDRLLGNKNIIAEKFYIYKELSGKLFKYLSEAIIIVDWSGCCSQQRWILQASLAMNGRSIPIYKEIHPLMHLSNVNIEKNFLSKLNDIIPKNVKIVIVTDAGFKSPWFKSVNQLGWDFVGRIRSRTQFSFDGNLWHKATDFNDIKNEMPIFLGNAVLGKTKILMSTNIYAYKSRQKGRKWKRKKYLSNAYPDRQQKQSKSHKESWVLATSLKHGHTLAKRVVNIYRARMQVEQNFRDMKNQRWGFGLRDSKTENSNRLEILLLISFIATMVLWLVAIVAESKKLHHSFQVNTERGRRVLSLFSLGWQIIRHGLNGRCRMRLETAYREIGLCHKAIVGV